MNAAKVPPAPRSLRSGMPPVPRRISPGPVWVPALAISPRRSPGPVLVPALAISASSLSAPCPTGFCLVVCRWASAPTALRGIVCHKRGSQTRTWHIRRLGHKGHPGKHLGEGLSKGRSLCVLPVVPPGVDFGTEAKSDEAGGQPVDVKAEHDVVGVVAIQSAPDMYSEPITDTPVLPRIHGGKPNDPEGHFPSAE